MDVINLISKVDGLPDAPISAPGEFYQPASTYFANGLVSCTACVDHLELTNDDLIGLESMSISRK